MTQNDFFEQQQQPSGQEFVILNEQPHQVKKRVFVYDGEYFEDPGPKYSIEDVLGFLAQSYPELENGTWHSRDLPDGAQEITFVKVTGEKGSDLSPALIAARLAAGTGPTRIKAIEVLREIEKTEQAGNLSPAYLFEAEPRLEQALNQAEQVAQASQRITARCLSLKPVPLPRVPLGF